MNNKFKYLRSFLIFDQEDSRFTEGGNSSGYVKIEVRDGKGKLSCQVSNLKEDIKTYYKLYMIKADNSDLMAVCAGSIPLVKGRGELNWNFNPYNVNNSGLTIEDFNIAAVMAENKDGSFGDMACPLVSYKDGKIEWRQKMRRFLDSRRTSEDGPLGKFNNEKAAYDEKNAENESNDVIGEELTSKYESVIESKYVKALSANDNNEESIGSGGNEEKKGDTGAIPQIDEQTQIFPAEKENNETMSNSTINNEENSAINNKESNKEGGSGELSDKNEYEKSKEEEKTEGQNGSAGDMAQNKSKPEAAGYKPTVKELAESFDRYFEKYNPFKGGRKEYRWWKVSSPVHLNNVLYQKDIKIPILFNPRVLMAHFKHRHLIVGTYEDNARDLSYIVFGVPGVYWVDEKPFGNICRWAQVEGSVPKYGAFGYWLVYINTKTGEILNIN
ncbi:MAG TPA: hypothetical protein PK033_02175 [Acetivibrio sp.]|nr:hypothetical protein [Clostridium sp.]HPT90800.1 hypothetical protein [Acetivibrio sp.]HQA56670.1 hypothetical protein [Acetivibrio sp.]